MRIDTTNLDEKALQNSTQVDYIFFIHPQAPFPMLQEFRHFIKTHLTQDKKEGADQEMVSATHNEDMHVQFMEYVKKLVDQPKWDVKAFPLVDIGDLFNVLGEKLQDWSNLGSNLNVILQAILVLATNTTFDPKQIENQRVRHPNTLQTFLQVLNEILKKSEDLKTSGLVLELGSLMKLKFLRDVEEKILSYALGYNQFEPSQPLNQPTHKSYFTLYEMETGVNRHGQFLNNTDIEFALEIETEGLNERNTTKLITLDQERINQEPAYDQYLASGVEEKVSKAYDKKFISALHSKIVWNRYLQCTEDTKQEKLTFALLLRYNAISFALSMAQEHVSPEFVKYAKECFLNECTEQLAKSTNKEILLKAASTLSKIAMKERCLVQLDSLLQPRENEALADEENKEGVDEDQSTSVLQQMLNDVSSISLTPTEQINGGGLERRCFPTYFSSAEMLSNSEFQEDILTMACGTIRLFTAAVRHPPEFFYQLINSFLKIATEIPVQNTYCYDLKVVAHVYSALRHLLKPKYEENLNFIAKFETRFVYEVENWQSKFYYYSDKEESKEDLGVDQKDRQSVVKSIASIICEQILKDVQGAGIVRKVMESKIITSYEGLLDLNTDESGHLVDALLPKYNHLIGAISQSAPDSISNLWKNNHITKLLTSLDQRLPLDKDAIQSIMYLLSQISLNLEVQEYLKQCKLYEKVILSGTEGGIRTKSLLLSSQDGRPSEGSLNFKNSISQYLDRSPVFMEQTKVLVSQVITHLKDLILQFYKQSRILVRSQSTLTKEEYAKKVTDLSNDPLIKERIYGGVIMLYSIGVNYPTQERQQMISRHSIDIYRGDIFKGLMDLFELLSEIPYSGSFFAFPSAILMKLFKFIVESQNFHENLAEYTARLKACFDHLRQLCGDKLPRLRSLAQFIQGEGEGEQSDIQPLENYTGENKESYLNKFELFLTDLSASAFYIKSFLQLSSATKLLLNSQYKFSQDIKTLFYLENAFNFDRAAHISNMYGQVLKEKSEDSLASDLSKQYGEALLQTLGEQEQELKHEQELLKAGTYTKSEAKEKKDKIKDFLMVNYRDNQTLEHLNRAFKDLQLSDFITKINALSQNQSQRRQQPRQLEITKNMGIFLGKTLYKLTKPFRSAKLNTVPLESPFRNLFEYLFIVDNNLGVLFQALANLWFEGESFYEFFKKGGLRNVTELFVWFKEIMEKVTSKEAPHFIVVLFDNCCLKLCNIITYFATMKGIDTQQSFPQITMTNEYDNIKHFFSNVYYTLCEKILNVEPGKEDQTNQLTKLYNERNPQMHDLVFQLLSFSSQGFPNCPYLKDGAAAERNRDGQRRRAPQPDPNVVAALESMGFPRDRIMAVLQTTSDINQATNILIEQAVSMPGNDFDFMGQGMQSSDESEGEVNVNPDTGNNEKLPKFSQDDYKAQQALVQKRGFDWVLQAQEEERIKKNKTQNYISSVMSNEKEPNAQKDMFQKVCGPLRKSMQLFKQKVLEPLKAPSSSDSDMIIDSSSQPEGSFNKFTSKLQSDLGLFQKIILRDKVYAKNAIKLDLINVLSNNLNYFLDALKLIKEKSSATTQDDYYLFNQIQALSLDLELTVLVMIQQLFFIKALYDDKHQKELKKEDQKLVPQLELKIKEYSSKLNASEIFTVSSKFIDLAYELQKDSLTIENKSPLLIKKSLCTLSLCIILKLLMEVEPQAKQEFSKQAFSVIEKLWIAKPQNNSVLIDQKLLQSVVIICFQAMKVPQSMFTNLIEKVLVLNFEELKHRKKDNPSDKFTDSATNYKGFLSFFKSLSSFDQESFIAATSESCMVKAQKKDTKVLQDTASIYLKEKTFSENQSKIIKDRQALAQLTKTFDIFNDQALKKTIKQNRKLALKSLDQEQKSQLLTLLQILSDSTASQYAETTLKFEEKKVGEQVVQINTDSSSSKPTLQLVDPLRFLDFISKLTQACPASTVMILQSHQYGPNKKGFVQWFIQDFLFASFLVRRSKCPGVKDQDPNTYSDISLADQDTLISILNNLTGYNHLMSFNEQVLKYELRTRFILESLLILQKATKTRQGNATRHRCQIITALQVIDALTNFKGPKQQGLKHIALDNYYNSIRALIFRGDPPQPQVVPAQQVQQPQKPEEKVQKLPASLIKTLQDLLSDKIDIAADKNAEIIRKSVSLLKLIADFFYSQRKKGQLKIEKLEGIKEAKGEGNKREENKQNQDMQMSDSEDEGHQVMQGVEGGAHVQEGEDDEEGDEDDDGEGEGEQEDEGNGDDDEEDEEDEGGLEDDGEGDDLVHQHIHIVDDEEDGENMDDDMDLNDNELLDQEDDQSEEDDDQGWGGGARIGERRVVQQVADIINMQHREEFIEMIGMGRRYQDVARQHPAGGPHHPHQELSEEEAQVGALLMNLRGLHSGAAQPGRRVPAQRPPGGMRYNGGGGGAEPAQVNPKVNILDLMFEGFKPLDTIHLLELAMQQKQIMDQEILAEEEARKAPLNEALPPPYLNRIDLNRLDYQQFLERELIGFNERERIFNRYEVNPNMIDDMLPSDVDWNLPFQGGGAMAFSREQFLQHMGGDPLFARPPHQFADQNFNFNVYNNAAGLVNPPGQDPNVLSRWIRPNNPALPQPDLSEQLLERVQVEVEEVKVEEKKKVSQTFANLSGSSSSNMSPNILMNEDEVEGERRRVEQMGRVNNEQIGIQREQIDRQQDELRRQGELFQALSQVNLGGILEQVDLSIQGQQLPVVQQQEQIQIQPPLQQPEEQLQPIASPRSSSQRSQNEEMKVEEVKQEEAKQEVQEQPPPVSNPNQTYGYDNELLLSNGIDPAILSELPEEMRVELLSSLDIQPVAESNQDAPLQQPVQEQPVIQQQQPQVEEQKQEGEAQQQQPNPAQQQQQQQPPQPEYMALALELGLDPTFLENIPEEYRRDIIENELRNRGGALPQRQAETMDTASFIASVTDPRLRQEIFAGLDEATIASLPPNLLAEARVMGDAMRNRQRQREQVERLAQNQGGLRQIQQQIDLLERRLRGEEADGYGRYIGGAHGHAAANIPVDNSLEGIILNRHKELASEIETEDIESIIACQLNSDERFIEALILILTTNESVECDLLPALCSLMKIQGAGNQFIMRNKIVNVLTYLLKIVALNDEEAIQILLPPTVVVNKRKMILILIGSLRLLIKNNRKLIRHILRSMLNKEEYFKLYGTNILKKQQKALALKQGASTVQPPLAEIFHLVRSPLFKNDPVLLKNLVQLIQQVIKQFDGVLQEMGVVSQQISKETVESLGEILQLDIKDSNLVNALGEFLFQMSKKKKENYAIISDFCENRSIALLEKLNTQLSILPTKIEATKLKLSPSKSDYNQSPMQNEDSVIETGSKVLKLTEEEERAVKQTLKLKEDSESLLRIFRLFNQFYSKFKESKDSDAEENLQPDQVTDKIAKFYQDINVDNLVVYMNEALKIVQNANIEPTESVINLIFCVFASFFPEIYEQVNREEKKEEEKKQVLMTPIKDSLAKQGAERFVVFRNVSVVSPRIETLSMFAYKNKRVINKIIRSKNNLFTQEMEGAIKHMSNILDFQNKRAYFKQELAKLRKSQYFEQIQLTIRRDNIFMDAYAQLGILSADQMKHKLHIQFIGERGQDAGGLTRDFFTELSRQMFNPNYSLFNLSSSGSTYYPNPKSYVEKDHLKYFKFIGRVIGKAIFEDQLLECYFVKTLYKMVIGEPLSFLDIEDYDNEFYNNLKWCLNNDIDSMGQCFAVEQDYFGKVEEIELIPNGKNIAVTNENKFEYIEKFAHHKLYSSISKQVDAFLEGVYELIPKDLVAIFNHKELELLISGLPYFDINDLRQNTEYQGYTATSPQVVWLFEILESFENSERAEFLQFVTGSSKIPLDGFKGLMGMRGPQKFNIAKVATEDIQRLPSGHTCFNQIDIPEYPSKEIMHERVLTAIKETKGFGFA